MTATLESVRSRNFAFILGSPRGGGNTEALARYAAGGLPPDTAASWLSLSELPLPATPEGPFPDGPEKVLLDATLDSTDIVVASPLHWYSVSAATKLYLDYWARWSGLPDVGFRDRMRGKNLWAVTAYARGDDADAEPLTGMLRRTADYLGMRWCGALLARAHRAGDLEADPAAMARATAFFDPAGEGARRG
ncbi:flavodoxin family protein [Streptomyces sp. NPDC014861]|uniref:flavodoxin family protein n=1 Tax=Streptomyces sp. NPDC014861 TaxID=3364923 RepID=UPI0036FF634C